MTAEQADKIISLLSDINGVLFALAIVSILFMIACVLRWLFK